MAAESEEMRSLALTPTWSVATVLTVFVAVSLVVERSIHRLSSWQFGYESCFIRRHALVYTRLFLGFVGQFLCSYSTLPLYALVTQMGTNYKAALIPRRIRDTMHGWGKAVRKRRKHRHFDDTTTIRTETSTVCSIEDDDQLLDDAPTNPYMEIELQPHSNDATTIGEHHHIYVHGNPNSSSNAPLLQSSSLPSTPQVHNGISRCASMPIWRA